MRLTRFTHTFQLGIKNLMLRKLRSGLTILGIIFGVASVIAMLAVGNGAAHEAQERIKKLGSNNIIIETIKPSEQEDLADSDTLSYGLTREDVLTLKGAIPGVIEVAEQRIMNENIVHRDIQRPAEIIGTQARMIHVSPIPIHQGRFLCQLDEDQQNTVCIINKSLSNELFAYLDPLGKIVRIKNAYFTIVGISEEKATKLLRATVSIFLFLPCVLVLETSTLKNLIVVFLPKRFNFTRL